MVYYKRYWLYQPFLYCPVYIYNLVIDTRHRLRLPNNQREKEELILDSIPGVFHKILCNRFNPSGIQIILHEQIFHSGAALSLHNYFLIMNEIQILGLAAGSCTTVAFLPQVIKTWKSGSAKDLSLGMFSFFALVCCSGLSMESSSGIFRSSWLTRLHSYLLRHSCTLNSDSRTTNIAFLQKHSYSCPLF